jgi:hypothetical protein
MFVDQIGSVRRVFASTSSAPAYDYDPFGVPLQATVDDGFWMRGDDQQPRQRSWPDPVSRL